MVDRLQKEINYLKKVGYFPDTVQTVNIRTDLHLQKCWTDAFWRRRKNHSRRKDPEIIYLQEYQKLLEGKTLEVGGAYGRVTRKLADLDSDANIFAIEVCPYFERYKDQYLKEYEKRVSFIFDDFFSSDEVAADEFDLIVIPMNTVPSFDVVMVTRLFSRVHEFLKPDGKVIFSTYGEGRKLRGENYVGELGVEIGEVPLAIEFFSLEDVQQEWGVESVTFSKYRYLDEGLSSQKLFRTTRAFFDHDWLIKVLEGANLEVIDKSFVEHSTIWYCKKLN